MIRILYFVATCKYVMIGTVIIFVTLALATTRVVAEQRPADCTGICDLAWSPADEHLLGAVDELGLWLYDTDENNNPPQFFSHEHSMSLSFDPQGKYVAVTSCPNFTIPTDPCKGEISLFNLQEQLWKQLGAYEYSIGNVKFSPDGKYIAFQKDEIGAWGIQLIDLTSDETFSIVDRNRTNAIIEYAFDPQSSYIAVSNGIYGYEGHDLWGISVWRLFDQTLHAFTEDSMLVADLAFVETNTNIMFVEYDTQVSTWNYSTGIISPMGSMVESIADNLNGLRFSYPPTYLLASLLDDWHPGDRKLFVWNLHSGEEAFFVDMPKNSFVDLITMTQDGKYVAYSSTVEERKILYIWDQSSDSTYQIMLR